MNAQVVPMYAPSYHPAMSMDLPGNKPARKIVDPKTDTIDRSLPPSYSEKIFLELPGVAGYEMELGRFSAFDDNFNRAYGIRSPSVMDLGMGRLPDVVMRQPSAFEYVKPKDVLTPLDLTPTASEFRLPKIGKDEASVFVDYGDRRVHEHLKIGSDGDVGLSSHLTVGTVHVPHSDALERINQRGMQIALEEIVSPIKVKEVNDWWEKNNWRK